MAAKSGARQKKSKRPDNRPARSRYWTQGRLALKKVKNLMQSCGMTKEQAVAHWLGTRKRHAGTIPSKLGA